jgi:hypothetical protein
MANYYLKNASASRVYRLQYAATNQPDDPIVFYSVQKVFVCDTTASPVLPDGTAVTEPDQEVTLSTILVDLVINELVDGTLADYRAAATGMIDDSWE